MLRSVTTRVVGFTILIGGIWGAIIPFVGPYFQFTLGPDRAWTWTTGRLYLDVLPAIVAIVGGLLLLGAGPWAAGRLGALLALVAGIWFVVGPDLSLLWKTGGELGAGHGTRTVQMLERLSFHTGLGVLMAALAAYALPGLLQVRARPVETVPGEPVGSPTTNAPITPAPTSPTGAPADAPGERVAA
ncbi:MAG TPA: hypothetical protein VGF70_09320 [Solirubrobacteraceae bacterium]